jgi:hypothetical protein
MEDWRGRGPVELGCSSLEPQVSKKTLLRAPAGRGRTRTTESACAPRATHCSRVEIPSSRKEQAGQDASSPIRLFSPSHAVSPHLPSATQLHTNFTPPRHDRHETATLQLSPCLAHALPMPNLRGGQVTSELAAGVGPCDALQHQREHGCVLSDPVVGICGIVALWHRRDCPAQMQHPSAVFTLRGALPSD